MEASAGATAPLGVEDRRASPQRLPRVHQQCGAADLVHQLRKDGGEWIAHAAVRPAGRSLRDRRIAPDDYDAKLGWLLVVGTIPAGLLGLLLEHAVRHLFASPQSASLFLVLNGFLLIGAATLRRRAPQTDVDDDRRITTLPSRARIRRSLGDLTNHGPPVRASTHRPKSQAWSGIWEQSSFWVAVSRASKGAACASARPRLHERPPPASRPHRRRPRSREIALSPACVPCVATAA